MEKYDIIYLQDYIPETENDFRDITWSDTKVDESDIEYILKSKYDELKEANENLKFRLNDAVIVNR